MANIWTQRVEDLLLNVGKSVLPFSSTLESPFSANQIDKYIVIYDLSQYFALIFFPSPTSRLLTSIGWQSA